MAPDPKENTRNERFAPLGKLPPFQDILKPDSARFSATCQRHAAVYHGGNFSPGAETSHHQVLQLQGVFRSLCPGALFTIHTDARREMTGQGNKAMSSRCDGSPATPRDLQKQELRANWNCVSGFFHGTCSHPCEEISISFSSLC